MDARFLGIDDIARTLNLNSRSRMQAFYDTVLAGQETVGLDIEGFDWADIQLDSDVEFAEFKDSLKGMATYVDGDSEPIARGRKVEISKLTASIPTQRRKIVRGKNDYKKLLLAASKAETMGRLVGKTPYNSVFDFLVNNLFDTLKDIPESHNASISYQVGQMKSKRGLILTSDNNNGGLKDVTFSAQVPEGNVDKTAWYKKSKSSGAITYIDTVDPILTLKKKVRSLKLDHYQGYQNVTVEMNAFTFFTLMEHPKVLAKIGYSLRPELNASPQNDENAKRVGSDAYFSKGDDFAKEWFKNAIGADAVIINTTVVGADKLNLTTKQFDTAKLDVFEDGVILVRPSGIIGSIYPVMIVRPDDSAIYANIFGGRGIIEYMYNKDTREQKWISELSVLAVPTMPKKMFYFEIQSLIS